MKLIKVTVDLTATTKEDMVRQLQDLIWDVKRLGIDPEHHRPAIWRLLSDYDKAKLAAEYAVLGRTRGAVQALADAHGWQKSFAMDCIQRLRGQGYLEQTGANQRPAITAKTLDLQGTNDDWETLAAEQGAE